MHAPRADAIDTTCNLTTSTTFHFSFCLHTNSATLTNKQIISSEMPGRCVAGGCGHTAKNGVSLHVFPSNPELREIWAANIRLSKPNWSGPAKHSVLCSAHFDPECFDRDHNRGMYFGTKRSYKLLPDAIPTKFLWSKKAKKRRKTREAFAEREKKRVKTATGTSSEAVLEVLGRDHLECVIYHESCEQPKMLNCQHSFSMKCLEQYHPSSCEQTTDIPCPVCRQKTRLPETGVQGLTTNLFFAGLVESFNLRESLPISDKKGITCEICEEGNDAHNYCLNCSKNICSKCKTVHTQIPDASHHTINTLEERFPKLETIAEEVSKSQKRVAAMKSDLDTNVDRTVQEVQSKATEIRAEVTAQENRLIQDIQKIQQDRRQQLEEYEKALSAVSERIQLSLEKAKEVTSSASDSDFLSLYPTISKDLTLLASQDVRQVGTGLESVKFECSQRVADINLDKVMGREGKWEQCLEFGQEQAGTCYDICTRDTSGSCYDVAVLGSDGISVYSKDGQYKTSIPLQSDAWGIASMQNQLVVVSEKTVQVYNNDNAVDLEFPTVPQSKVNKKRVNLWSVAIREDGRIIVGDVRRKVLTEHSADGKLSRTLPVDMKPYFLAVHSNRMVISGETDAVHVTDRNGVTRAVISPSIPEGAVQCRGVYMDTSGIYIAIKHDAHNTGHIHHYDAQGSFLTCIAQGLYDPHGIAFTADGKLLVADWESSKTYNRV